MLNVIDITRCSKVSLVNDVVGAVVDNMGGGEWRLVHYLKVPDGPAGMEELCHGRM